MTALAHRLAIAADLPFIFGGWLSAFRPSNDAGPIPAETYAATYKDAISRLLGRPSVDVIVACHPDETDHVADLYGFIAAEKTSRGPVVHFCFVKKIYQRQGIARGLFAAAQIDPRAPFTYTYRTPVARQLVPHATYDPYCARFETAWREDRQEKRP